MASAPFHPDAELLAEHADRMRGLARGLLRDYDRAEDVAQEASLLALTGRVRPRTTLAACLTGVVRNVAAKLRRSDRRRRTHEAAAARPPHAGTAAAPDELLARLETQQRVLASVRGLAEPYRTAILLRYIDGLPPREIARQLDQPVETVKSHLKRGLAQLRRMLDDAHGGSRRAWLPALLPVAGWSHLAGTVAGTTLAPTGGLMAQASSKKVATAAVLLLALGAAVWFVGDGLGWFDDADPGETRTAAAPTSPDGDVGLVGRETDAKAADADPDADAGSGAPGVATADPADASPEVKVPGSGRAPSTLPPIRHSPFAPPVPRGQKQDGAGANWATSGGGGMGPTGHWTRFPLMKEPVGTARLKVRVVGTDGAPIEAAKVYIGPDNIAGRKGISFGSLRTLGTTDAQGWMTHETLTPGAVAVCANVGGLLSGRYGLDARTAKRTTLANGAGRQVEITLPIETKSLGTVVGTVRDAAGEPIRSAQVVVGRNHTRTDRRGAYKLLRVPAGKHSLQVSKWSYTANAVDIDARAGGTITKDVTLELKEAGTIRILGQVTGPKGEVVPECDVYLNGKNMTLRSTRTDKEGRYAFTALPERLTKDPVEVQASGIPRYGSVRLPFKNGIADGQVIDLQIQQRFVDVIFEVREAGSKELVRRIRIEAKPIGDEKRRGGFFWYREKLEGHQGILEPGRYRVTIDGLDHAASSFDLDVPHTDPFRHPVVLTRTSPDSVDVHLTIDLYGASEDTVVKKAKIEILDADGRALGRFEGMRDGGRYLLPAPSGKRTLVIAADGYEEHREVLELDPAVLEVTHKVHLRAK